MIPQQLQEYFVTNPPPKEVQWKEWAKITDTEKFIENALMCIRLYKGSYKNCPDYWHLLEFYNDLQEGKI